MIEQTATLIAKLYIWVRSNAFGPGRGAGLSVRIYEALGRIKCVTTKEQFDIVRRHSQGNHRDPRRFLYALEREYRYITEYGFQDWRYK